MRLSLQNIRFVKELSLDGITYGWYVSMGSVFNSREYINYAGDRTTCEPYDKNLLPSTVRRFIELRNREIFTSESFDDGGNYTEYIYR